MEAITKVFLEPPKVASPSLSRVADALTKYKPEGVEIVSDEAEADIVVLHVIGRQDQVLEKARNLPRYAVIQYAVRSTLRPATTGWLPLWENADLVWSYYDLFSLCEEDGITPDFDFYHSALGVDPIFQRSDLFKTFLIATSGQSYLTESVRECVLAASHFPLPVFHLGAELDKERVTCKTGISDEELCHYYSQAMYVSGLRRVEGFELPAAEGLLCGARPILFDKPHYRKWFNGLALFIPEGDRDEVIKSLVKIFAAPYQPVTVAERRDAAQRFNWETICTKFWEKLI